MFVPSDLRLALHTIVVNYRYYRTVILPAGRGMLASLPPTQDAAALSKSIAGVLEQEAKEKALNRVAIASLRR